MVWIVGMTKCQQKQHCAQLLLPAKAHQMLQQYRTWGSWNITLAREVPLLLFCSRSLHHDWQIVISCNTQQGYGHVVPVTAKQYAENTPIQGTHDIHTWPRPIKSRLSVLEQLYRKQGLWDHWHEHNVNAISTLVNTSVCTSIEDIQAASWEDAHLQKLIYIIQL